MSASARRRRWLELPISLQILGLLLSGLIVAQIVTLILTLVLPPRPPQQHSLTEIAQALSGGEIRGGKAGLVRSMEAAPPSLQSPGWVVAERSTLDLARMLNVPEADVRLLFYAPPPLVGATPPLPAMPPRAAVDARPTLVLASFALLDQGGPPAGGGPGGPGGPGGGFPGGGFPGGGFPGGGAPLGGGVQPWPFPRPSMSAPPSTRSAPSPAPGMPSAGRPPGFPQSGGSPQPGSAPAPPPGGSAGGTPGGGPGPQRPRESMSPLDAAVFAPAPRAPSSAGFPVAARPVDDALRMAPTVAPVTAAPPVVATPRADFPRMATLSPVAASAINEADAADSQPARALPAPVAPRLFGLGGPPPLVEGQFVAARRVAPGRWVTVKPRPEGFPNSWQRRILLWFAVSFALVAPLGYLFARRLAAPLLDFANAAEILGRDPSAEVSTREGPAEVGRAARAFNVMQSRLKRYVDDRTGMIGAISHDLRTPLARMRFRLERAPRELQVAMGKDIAQMEEMITSVLTFMREDAAATPRQRVDLRSVLEVVVDDAAGLGPIELHAGPTAEVEIDLIGIQRVFENLVDNALKYGERAEVRLYLAGEEAVAEVADKGPGLTHAELQQVFQPFYRGPEARTSAKGGVGLGLAVSRSAVRAHGGDLTLEPTSTGLLARVTLPIAAAARAA